MISWNITADAVGGLDQGRVEAAAVGFDFVELGQGRFLLHECLVTLAGEQLQASRSKIVMTPRVYVMTPLSCILRATSVTEVLRTPSISDNSPWVKATVLLAARSEDCSSQRQKRSSI